MKKLFLKLGIVLVLITTGLMLTLNSCEKRSDCEINNYGDVTVTNQTGYRIKVDVTWGGSVYNDERWINNGSSTTYNRVPAGNVVIWGSLDDWDWSSANRNLTQCDNLRYTWYLNKSLEIKDDFGEFIKTEETSVK